MLSDGSNCYVELQFSFCYLYYYFWRELCPFFFVVVFCARSHIFRVASFKKENSSKDGVVSFSINTYLMACFRVNSIYFFDVQLSFIVADRRTLIRTSVNESSGRLKRRTSEIIDSTAVIFAFFASYPHLSSKHVIEMRSCTCIYVFIDI